MSRDSAQEHSCVTELGQDPKPASLWKTASDHAVRQVLPGRGASREGMCCRMLAADDAAMRALKGERPNGVSEMPDPEAAEYLAKHQTKALGGDVMNAVKNHYNGTQEEHVQPASTDSHATIEEHVTEVRHHSPDCTPLLQDRLAASSFALHKPHCPGLS